MAPRKLETNERDAIDVRVDSLAREGLAGTTPTSVYDKAADPQQITRPPDDRPLEEQPPWRRDFPIDWPQDHYIARRDFTKFLVLTSFAFACGQCWIAAKSMIARREQTLLPRKRVASLTALAVGSTTLFSYPGDHDPCFLVRVDADSIVAYSQECTHLACAVVPRPSEGVIHCPCHAGFFDLSTGRVLAGPPPRPLPRITLEVSGDDVYATGVERRTV